MTRRRKLALLFLVLALASGLAPAAAAARPAPGGAAELLAAESAHAASVAVVRGAPGWIGPRHSPHAAVARGLDEVGGALAQTRAALAAGDAALPRALRRGSVALAGLRVAWSRSGLAAPAAARRLHELAVAYDRLRARCGPEGARAARGGGLSAAERRHLGAVQAARRGLAAELAPLQAAAAAQGERALAGDLQRWIAQSERLAAAPASVEVLLEAVWLADLLHGEWTAATPHVPPPARGDWLAAHAAVEEVLGASEVGYLAIADLGDGSEPLRVEPAAAGEEEAAESVELHVLAPEPGALFPPQDLEQGWAGEEGEEGEEEGGETADAAAAAAAEEDEEQGEESAAAAGDPAAVAEEPAAEPDTIEVVGESGEVVTIVLTKEGEPTPSSPSSDPPAAAEPAPAEPPAQPL